MNNTDVIIIGSGIAALQLANHLRHDKNVIIFTKGELLQSNSSMAQGGIAAVVSPEDTIEKHFYDTIDAGEKHNDEEAVNVMLSDSIQVIQQLIQSGCPFDRNALGELQLGLEGAHSEKRILHAGGDATGKIVTSFLHSNLPNNVKIIEHFQAFDLHIDEAKQRCIGIKGLNAELEIESYYAKHVVLATGGCGQLYEYTSNSPAVTGDGLALAYLAGADLVDMEFVQFHPTLLYVNGVTKGLISEAVRGEGAYLVNEKNEPIMANIHPLKDLAPRHIVANVILEHLSQGEKVFLNISMIEDFEHRFPTITKLCRQNGIELDGALIPVAPGSHFLMGGVKTDLVGRTSIQRLYAIGEAAWTGVHGANRLASNSLLEGLVFGKRLATYLNDVVDFELKIPSKHESKKAFVMSKRTLPTQKQVKEMMMKNVGMIRHQQGLQQFLVWIDSYNLQGIDSQEFETFSKEEMTVYFMMLTGSLIAQAALRREESRGGHYRSDYPVTNDRWTKQRTKLNKRELMGDSYEQSKTAFNT